MQIHQLQLKHKLKGKKRVGRGGKKGTYSGRGGKGQTARSGRKMEPFIREIIKRYPKLKGYRSFNLPKNAAVVNLAVVENKYSDGEMVSPASLIEKGILRMMKGKNPVIKILGSGKLTKKLSFENVKASKSAKEAIEKVGGSVNP